MLVDLRSLIVARDKARHNYNGDLGYLGLLQDVGERAKSRVPTAETRAREGLRRLQEAEKALMDYYENLDLRRE